MRNIRTGHQYYLENFENKDKPGQKLQFIEKEKNEQGVFVTIYDGTTNEEVLEMLIDRMEYLQKKFACAENAMVIQKLHESLFWLNKRTADRVKRNVEGTPAA